MVNNVKFLLCAILMGITQVAWSEDFTWDNPITDWEQIEVCFSEFPKDINDIYKYGQKAPLSNEFVGKYLWQTQNLVCRGANGCDYSYFSQGRVLNDSLDMFIYSRLHVCQEDFFVCVSPAKQRYPVTLEIFSACNFEFPYIYFESSGGNITIKYPKNNDWPQFIRTDEYSINEPFECTKESTFSEVGFEFVMDICAQMYETMMIHQQYFSGARENIDDKVKIPQFDEEITSFYTKNNWYADASDLDCSETNIAITEEIAKKVMSDKQYKELESSGLQLFLRGCFNKLLLVEGRNKDGVAKIFGVEIDSDDAPLLLFDRKGWFPRVWFKIWQGQITTKEIVDSHDLRVLEKEYEVQDDKVTLTRESEGPILDIRNPGIDLVIESIVRMDLKQSKRGDQ